MTNIYISPRYVRDDRGADGGIRRVIEAQTRLLPELGYSVTDTPEQADILAIHAGANVSIQQGQHVVAHCHGLYWSEYKWGRWADQVNEQVIASLRISDACTTPSEWVARVLQRGMRLSPYVISHGVDTDKWQPSLNPQGYVLWNKARTDAVSDPAPMTKLAHLVPNVDFVSTMGTPTNNVKITGIVPHTAMPELVANAGVYLATTRETFGINTLEAMSCGVPILGFNYGATPEILQHEVHGWLASVDDYESLRHGLDYCLQNRERLGEACRELAKKYTWERAISDYDVVYKQLSCPGVKVSIIVTTYNVGKYIQQCIESVLTQDFKDYELILVDDCSTDDCDVVNRGYANVYSQVHAYKTPVNSKAPGAFNYGIERANGEYILVLDGDNILEPGCLQTLSSQLDQYRDLDIAYGRVRFITEDGQLDTVTSGSADGISAWPTEFDFAKQFGHHNQIPSTCMYRKTIYDRVGGYRHRAPPAEDADFWCRAVLFGAHASMVTDAVTFTYRMRPDSASHTLRDWPWERWYTLQEPPFGAITGNRPVVSSYNMDQQPKVSVIIPVGQGHDKLVQDALDSIYIQTLKEWECIVVDDTDTGIEHIPSWAKLVLNRTNHGVSPSRNLGLICARGKAVVFLDADDYLRHDALEKMWDVFTRYGGYVYCDIKHLEDNRVIETPNNACSTINKMLSHPMCGMYPNLSNLRFDEAFVCGEDWDYVLGVHSEGYCGTRIAEPLVNYRTSSGTRRQELIKTIDEVRSKIDSKWGGIMACGCQRGGGGVAQKAQTANIPHDDMLLLEYVGPNSTMTYVGKTSGTNYRFGSDEGHKIKYVYKVDAPQLLERPEFALAQLG